MQTGKKDAVDLGEELSRLQARDREAEETNALLASLPVLEQMWGAYLQTVRQLGPLEALAMIGMLADAMGPRAGPGLRENPLYRAMRVCPSVADALRRMEAEKEVDDSGGAK